MGSLDVNSGECAHATGRYARRTILPTTARRVRPRPTMAIDSDVWASTTIEYLAGQKIAERLWNLSDC